jgi:hypothetical protein
MFLRRIALAIGLLCGLLATQAPEFAQQYRQRLAGAVDELSRVVGIFDDDAAKRSLTPPEAITRLENNPDPVVHDQGVEMQSHIGRLERLKAALAAFRDSALWRRLLVLAGDFDFATARKAWQDFEPAVPTSADAIAVGILGLIIGWGATHLFAWPVRRHLQKRRERNLVESPRFRRVAGSGQAGE